MWEPCCFSHASREGFQIWVLLANGSYICIYIESTTLTDGTYELVTESESEQCEAQVNLTEVIKDANQSSEEPKASLRA
jgi:hypothetical protein